MVRPGARCYASVACAHRLAATRRNGRVPVTPPFAARPHGLRPPIPSPAGSPLSCKSCHSNPAWPACGASRARPIQALWIDHPYGEEGAGLAEEELLPAMEAVSCSRRRDRMPPIKPARDRSQPRSAAQPEAHAGRWPLWPLSSRPESWGPGAALAQALPRCRGVVFRQQPRRPNELTGG